MKHLIKYTIILLATLASFYAVAQTVETIDLPSDGGSMIGDIIHANGKIFAYAPDGVSVFKVTDNSFLNKIVFDNSGIFFGKFNPVYYDGGGASPDQSLMVYNPNNQYLYVITPKLKFLVINTDSISQTWIISLPVQSGSNPKKLDEALQSQNDVVILKYDDANDRLYVHVAGRDSIKNCTGNFHTKQTLFGIYNIDTALPPDNDSHITVQYTELKDPNNPNVELGDHINNFVFNELNDYFYVVRLGRREVDPPYVSRAIIEIREVTADSSELIRSIDFVNKNGSGYFKMGKMLYINDTINGVHKIIVFPFTYFVADVPEPRFCVIDGDDPFASEDTIRSPSKRILDAVYLEENQDLILSYAPDNNEIVYADPNTNIAVFHYDSIADSFELSHQFADDNSVKTSDFDLNAALHLTKINGTTALIGKKDEIAKLEYGNGSYTYEPLLRAEGNFFWKGAVAGNKTFVHNAVANGMEVIGNSNYNHTANIRTGFPVYYIAANAEGGNLYFYNKLNAYDVGLYAYQPGDSTTTHINTGTAIGDIVYNSFQNHFLISKFEPGNAKILVLDASNNDSITEIDLGAELSGAQFAKEMFISPNGRLYVCANMNYSSGRNPSVFIYDATDANYNVVSHEEVNDFNTGGYNVEFPYYASYFDYNRYDSSVYISMAVQDAKLMPYNSQASSLYRNYDSIALPVPPGKLLVVNDSIRQDINIADFPGKLICPDLGEGNDTSQYFGKLFIIGEQLHVYDYINPNALIQSYPHYFIDIAYSNFHDKLFAVKEDTNIGCKENRIFEIWTIYYNESGLQIQPVMTMLINDGQIASMFYNPYDRRIYVYQKIDGAKLGRAQVKLMSFDPATPNAGWETDTLGIKSYFPDYDHTVDLAQFYYYNMTTPYISLSSGHIYLPNGGHSCVSEIPFDTRSIRLRPGENGDPGITWLSIPRHLRPDTALPELTPTSTVFAQQNVSGGYEQLKLTYNNIKPDYTEDTVTATWNIQFDWQYTDDTMQNINSILGYKLELKPNEEKLLYLWGILEDPGQSMSIKSGVENWTGYWLYEEQDIFDALGSVVDSLYLIKHQDWTCIKGIAPWLVPQQVPPPWEAWFCDNRLRNIKYGEMVVLKGNRSDFSFQWNHTGQGPDDENGTQNPAYYAYEEQPDYTPMIIELDSADNPVEIGAFIGDTCIGANVVEAGDSVVTIRTYLQGNPGDSVVFEQYYGNKSTAKQRIESYYVWDKERKLNEKRAVGVGEQKDHYFISFKKTEGKERRTR
ncbi:MAG: hypothetical protein L3J66_14125 [Bacteroidales bacterium]|nr:hypothetical protein [Bacteroidales bacterium]